MTTQPMVGNERHSRHRVGLGGQGTRDLVRLSDQAKTHPPGGDEVALFHACYVGTHTDRRLFIYDTGNGRIVSVRLDYHAAEQVTLKDTP